MLNASRLRDFHPARVATMNRLIARIRAEALASDVGVWVLPNVCFTFFSILLSITFGVNLDENSIIRVDEVMKWVLLIIRPRMDDYIPFLRPFFANNQKKVLQVRQEQLDTVIPLINNRRSILENPNLELNVALFSYIDSLLDLKVNVCDSVPTNPELVTLCYASN
ncbi:Cytochrome P450 [Canna indica]|uniref:Cytochrome P450 n=1 Tax=Canna indica TaxID=4628 RepID=A0AAQ3Q2E0_9LILI|nr:Cytochrome P450 [Canna indica]